MPTRVRILRNRVPAVRANLEREAKVRVGRAAHALRDAMRADLDGGKLPLGPDTGALSASLFVQEEAGSDYGASAARAQSAYVGGGRWQEPVREHVSPEAYTAAHFQARLGPEEPLPAPGPHRAFAGVATALAYGGWWQWGHFNAFTRRDEGPRDWFAGPSEAWLRANLARQFARLRLT